MSEHSDDKGWVLENKREKGKSHMNDERRFEGPARSRGG